MLPGNLSLWLTPVWLMSVGVTLGALVLLVLFGLLWIISRPAASAVLRVVRESILQPISYVVAAFVTLCLVLAPTMPVDSVLASLRRLPHVGTTRFSVEIPAKAEDHEVNVAFHADELTRYAFESPQDVIVGVEKGKAFSDPLIFVEANEPHVWFPREFSEREFKGNVDRLYVTNPNDTPVKLTIDFNTQVEVPEVQNLPVIAVSVVGLYLVYLLTYWLLPGLSAIALATSKEAVAQPLYLLSLVMGTVLFVAFIYIPYNTFGEDVKMLKDSGMTTIMVLSIFVGLWTTSVSVAEEIEGRTALTLLSKPISRRQFVLGKFLGIIWPIVLMYIVLGVVLLVTVSFKVVYDSRESSNPTPDWQTCYEMMISTVPGLVLALMETIVLVAISVAISTRLPMLPNLIICGSIYALGHLGPLIVQSSAGQLEYVAFIGRLIAVVLPVLDHFNIQAAVAGGVDVPTDYLGWALLYCVLYSAAAMLLALVLFEDRDLA